MGLKGNPFLRMERVLHGLDGESEAVFVKRKNVPFSRRTPFAKWKFENALPRGEFFQTAQHYARSKTPLDARIKRKSPVRVIFSFVHLDYLLIRQRFF